MKRVTRNVPPTSVHDLLERPARACIAFAGGAGPFDQPVVLMWDGERYIVGVPAEAQLQPAEDQEVVLLVDEGVYFFDLRALYVRGQAHSVPTPANAPAGYVWYEVLPLKTVAWDYGMLREDDGNGSN